MNGNRHSLRAAQLLAWATLPLGLLAWAVGDERFWRLGVNTFQVAGGTALFAVPCGSFLAIILLRTDVPGRRAMVLLLSSLLFLPLYAYVAAWEAALGLQGMITRLASPTGGSALLGGMPAAIFVHALAAIPWAALIVGVGLFFSEPEEEEAALLAGGPLAVLWRLTAVRSLPFIIAAALFVFVAACGEIAVTDAYLVRTYAEELYLGFSQQNELSDAPLQVLPGLLALAWLCAASGAALMQLVPPSESSGLRRPQRLALRAMRWPAGIAAGLLLALAGGIPLVSLVAVAGTKVGPAAEGTLHRQWEFLHLARMVGLAFYENGPAWRGSLAVAALAAVVAAALAAPLAYWAHERRHAACLLGAATALAMAVPGPAVGLAIIAAMNRTEVPFLAYLYDRSLTAPCLAAAWKGLPLAGVLLFFAFRTLDRSSLETASLEGAGLWRRFVGIALPQRRPALAAALLVALALALGDLATTILVLPPGLRTLAQVSADEIHRGVHDRFAALSLATAAVFVVLSLGAQACLAQLWPREERSASTQRPKLLA